MLLQEMHLIHSLRWIKFVDVHCVLSLYQNKSNVVKFVLLGGLCIGTPLALKLNQIIWNTAVVMLAEHHSGESSWAFLSFGIAHLWKCKQFQHNTVNLIDYKQLFGEISNSSLTLVVLWIVAISKLLNTVKTFNTLKYVSSFLWTCLVHPRTI